MICVRIFSRVIQVGKCGIFSLLQHDSGSRSHSMNHLDIQVGLYTPALGIRTRLPLGSYNFNRCGRQVIGCVIFIEIGLHMRVATSVNNGNCNAFPFVL